MFHPIRHTPARRAFTLIELLIVVAIIAILAAIAVPNFLEAQTRSKVTRVKADHRTIATALEAYYVDNNTYPLMQHAGAGTPFSTIIFEQITTPIAYLTSAGVFVDPFRQQFAAPVPGVDAGYPYLYANFIDYGPVFMGFGPPSFDAWCVTSVGPDQGEPSVIPMEQTMLGLPYIAANFPPALVDWWGCIYDPTNGTVSGGDIGRTGGSTPAEAAQMINR